MLAYTLPWVAEWAAELRRRDTDRLQAEFFATAVSEAKRNQTHTGDATRRQSTAGGAKSASLPE